ncbi:hypothetical protein [Sphingomicrobium astaxanthinifaciens]|uniref:hypothetical protein n=1 Tax=Sphingomicrobium astaxanthinifaciens TaxID=1227949 RepID=UPI001FCCB0FB|nr:hypothetical protein [Sphingomicrobium astaxanthinifaciens]MCJ7420443.1 hypothetical protein [Sphingomicrobium astaxanthinifaciens]
MRILALAAYLNLTAATSSAFAQVADNSDRTHWETQAKQHYLDSVAALEAERYKEALSHLISARRDYQKFSDKASNARLELLRAEIFLGLEKPWYVSSILSSIPQYYAMSDQAQKELVRLEAKAQAQKEHLFPERLESINKKLKIALRPFNFTSNIKRLDKKTKGRTKNHVGISIVEPHTSEYKCKIFYSHQASKQYSRLSGIWDSYTRATYNGFFYTEPGDGIVFSFEKNPKNSHPLFRGSPWFGLSSKGGPPKTIKVIGFADERPQGKRTGYSGESGMLPIYTAFQESPQVGIEQHFPLINEIFEEIAEVCDLKKSTIGRRE